MLIKGCSVIICRCCCSHGDRIRQGFQQLHRDSIQPLLYLAQCINFFLFWIFLGFYFIFVAFFKSRWHDGTSQSAATRKSCERLILATLHELCLQLEVEVEVVAAATAAAAAIVWLSSSACCLC